MTFEEKPLFTSSQPKTHPPFQSRPGAPAGPTPGALATRFAPRECMPPQTYFTRAVHAWSRGPEREDKEIL